MAWEGDLEVRVTVSDLPAEGVPEAAPAPGSGRSRSRSRGGGGSQDEPSRSPAGSAQARPRRGAEARDAEPAPPRAEAPGEPVRAPTVRDVDLDDGRIDEDAARVVRRLTRAGYEAYLVGGCVRDLLLGFQPKDFDVATSARPDDVRRLFRNSRIIGRRFRLVHVLFSAGKVIETATFRRAPQESERSGDDLLIRNDNVFGEAHEDAERRDFTINGLFYDLERGQVLDWVGGLPHIESRSVQTIGDPVTRFQEDPVRMLRAIKFAARLDCGIAPEVYDAIVLCRDTLAMAARPRLFEELLRLLRGGASHRSFWLAWETGVLDVLLPELSAWLADDTTGRFWTTLQALDRATKERQAPLDDVVLWAALVLEPMLEACGDSSDRMASAYDFLEGVVDRLNVPRRIADSVRRIAAVLPRMAAGKAPRFARTPLHALGVEVLALRAAGRLDEAPAPAPRAAAPRRARRRAAAPPAELRADEG